MREYVSAVEYMLIESHECPWPEDYVYLLKYEKWDEADSMPFLVKFYSCK